MTEEQEKAAALLEAADVFYHNRADEYDPEEWGPPFTLNMNDTWCWASGWGETIPEEELPEVARLFRTYGQCGLLYWMSEKHNQMRSEFHDINRFVDFVRAEENIRKEVTDYNRRAYHKASYTLGAENGKGG